jgi:DNA-binding transcriptional regulator YiaG
MSGPRDVLVALEGALPWMEPPRRAFAPVSESALAPRVEERTQRGPEQPTLSPEEILWIRRAGDLSQVELASILGVGDDRVGQLERGQPANRAEAEVLEALRVALEAMPNEADRIAWARSIAALAAEDGYLRGLLQILADGAVWRDVGDAAAALDGRKG